MPKRRDIPDGFAMALVGYKNLECSTVDLAMTFGAHRSTVCKWMRELGIEPNDPSVAAAAKLTGKPGKRLGAKHTEETKSKLRLVQAGRSWTTKGFRFSEESKKKMRESARIRALREGKKLAPEKAPRKTSSQKVKRIPAKRIELTEAERIARNKARDACKRMIRRVLTMARVKKDGRRSELLLGYSKADLRVHLESQFRDGMSWDVRDSFHIDHIKPVAQFFREGVYDPSVINALSNLQVLTPEENRRKSDKYIDTSKRSYA